MISFLYYLVVFQMNLQHFGKIDNHSILLFRTKILTKSPFLCCFRWRITGHNSRASGQQPAGPGHEPHLQQVHGPARRGPAALLALQSSDARSLRLRPSRGSLAGAVARSAVALRGLRLHWPGESVMFLDYRAIIVLSVVVSYLSVEYLNDFNWSSNFRCREDLFKLRFWSECRE